MSARSSWSASAGRSSPDDGLPASRKRRRTPHETRLESENPTFRAGELLKGMAERGQRTTRKTTKSHDVIRLPDLGIKPIQSSRWQRMASVPEKNYNAYLAYAKADGENRPRQENRKG